MIKISSQIDTSLLSSSAGKAPSYESTDEREGWLRGHRALALACLRQWGYAVARREHTRLTSTRG
jgi:hypothetical protein